MITIQNLLDYAKTHAKLTPVLGIAGITNEPGLSICKDTIQELLSAPFAWKFNRSFAGAASNTYGNFFVTQPFIQDYQYAGAVAFVLPTTPPNAITSLTSVGGAGIALSPTGITRSGATVTVNTLDPHPFTVGQTVFHAGATVAAYNATFTGNNIALTSTWSGGYVITVVPSTTSYQFTIAGTPANSGAPGINDFGWLDSASARDIQSTQFPQFEVPIQAVDNLTPTGDGDSPGQASVIQQMLDSSGNPTGVLKFRTYLRNSSYIWQINFTWQKAPPILTGITSTFNPWPDSLGYVLRQGVLAKAFNLIDDKRAQVEELKFQRAIGKALIRWQTERSSEGFAPSCQILRG